MLTIGLDLSTKPGWAIFDETKLIRHGTLFAQHTANELGTYPDGYMKLAEQTAERVVRLVIPWNEICNVVIEESTASSQNYSQKRLEWIHLEVLRMLRDLRPLAKIFYVRDGVWKRLTGATQNKEERNWNARISRYKKKHNKKIAKLKKEGEEKATRVRRLDSKDYAIRAVKEIYGVELERTDEDAADAILISTAFLWGCPVCDGTTTGGILTEAECETLWYMHHPNAQTDKETMQPLPEKI